MVSSVLTVESEIAEKYILSKITIAMSTLSSGYQSSIHAVSFHSEHFYRLTVYTQHAQGAGVDVSSSVHMTRFLMGVIATKVMFNIDSLLKADDVCVYIFFD